VTVNVLAELKAGYGFMSRVEKRIADCILQNPKAFITFSMGELSQTTGVSQGSINNFAKKFSGGGFSALKLQVAGCLSSMQTQPFAVIDQSQGLKAAMKLKMEENAAAFRNTYEINEESVLSDAVKRILAAKKIEIYGIFHSGISARDFCYQLIQLGIPANFVSDTLMCAVSASMLDENGLVIAISSSGRTKEIVDAVEIAKRNGVPIICLTSDKFSPLAKVSDDVLLSASSGMSISDRPGEIRLSQQLVLDTLCAYIRSVIDASGQKHFYKLREIICSHSIKD